MLASIIQYLNIEVFVGQQINKRLKINFVTISKEELDITLHDDLQVKQYAHFLQDPRYIWPQKRNNTNKIRHMLSKYVNSNTVMA